MNVRLRLYSMRGPVQKVHNSNGTVQVTPPIFRQSAMMVSDKL